MQGNQQQAYDRGITIFSPDGRLYQVEYAREAVAQGSAAVGVRTDDGVVIAADRQPRSPLIERESIEKVHDVDAHVAIGSAGHVADARQLIDFARRQAQVERLRYDQAIDVEALTKQVTDHIQQYTQTGGARPFGAALLVGGVTDGEARLFETDPSGTPYEWQANAIGGGRDEAQRLLEDEYRAEADLDGGITLALRALAETSDELTATSVDLRTVDVESASVRSLSVEELEDYLVDADLAGETDE
ncbi:MAG: archaeal proteasome endopeptidase complex subunit alpha [Haloarculaceae archaeon]